MTKPIYKYSVSLTPPREPTLADKIEALEDVISDFPPPEDAFKWTHHFAPGLYARECFIPKDHTVVGVEHKTEHLVVLAQGRAIVASQFGVEEMTAPCVFLSRAGSKRAVYAFEDTTFITFHPTEETDLDKLCTALTTAKPEELFGHPKNKQIERQRLKMIEKEMK